MTKVNLSIQLYYPPPPPPPHIGLNFPYFQIFNILVLIKFTSTATFASLVLPLAYH